MLSPKIPQSFQYFALKQIKDFINSNNMNRTVSMLVLKEMEKTIVQHGTQELELYKTTIKFKPLFLSFKENI